MVNASVTAPLLSAAAAGDPEAGPEKACAAGRPCRCDGARATPRRWAALAAALAGAVLLFLVFPCLGHALRLGGPESSTSGPRGSGLPAVQITGGPPALRPHYGWVSRACTEHYSGPHCARPESWNGTVTLHLDGVAIPGVRMHTRGHVSTFFPKKQFSVELPEPVGLLGMAPSRKWVLAMSFIDTTFQRNPLAFDIYRRLGGWSPETRYVTVQWDEDFIGVYYFAERIEVAPGRLQIPESDPASPERSGYLLTVDWPKEGEASVNTGETSTAFSFAYPKRPSPAQEAFIQRLVDTVDQRAAAHGGGGDLAEVLDFGSVARYFVLQELAMDIDGYAFSDYMAVRGGKLEHAAPWDYDLAFGFECRALYFSNAYTGENSANSTGGWNVENLRDSVNWFGPNGYSGGSVKYFGTNKRQLFLNIWGQPGFRKAFVSAWREARSGALTDEALSGMVERRAEQIEPAAQRDVALWRDSERCAFFECCHPEDAADFRSATLHLRQHLLSRARWIDAHAAGLL